MPSQEFPGATLQVIFTEEDYTQSVGEDETVTSPVSTALQFGWWTVSDSRKVIGVTRLNRFGRSSGRVEKFVYPGQMEVVDGVRVINQCSDREFSVKKKPSQEFPGATLEVVFTEEDYTKRVGEGETVTSPGSTTLQFGWWPVNNSHKVIGVTRLDRSGRSTGGVEKFVSPGNTAVVDGVRVINECRD
jgi:hypothetical protein